MASRERAQSIVLFAVAAVGLLGFAGGIEDRNMKLILSTGPLSLVAIGLAIWLWRK